MQPMVMFSFRMVNGHQETGALTPVFNHDYPASESSLLPAEYADIDSDDITGPTMTIDIGTGEVNELGLLPSYTDSIENKILCSTQKSSLKNDVIDFKMDSYYDILFADKEDTMPLSSIRFSFFFSNE